MNEQDRAAPPKEPMSDEPGDDDLRKVYEACGASAYSNRARRILYNHGYNAGRASRDAEVTEFMREAVRNQERAEAAEAEVEALRKETWHLGTRGDEAIERVAELEAELARLHADSMRGAVEMLRAEAMRLPGEFRSVEADRLMSAADWLESQAPKADPERESELSRSHREWRYRALRAEGRPDAESGIPQEATLQRLDRDANYWLRSLDAAEKASKP